MLLRPLRVPIGHTTTSLSLSTLQLTSPGNVRMTVAAAVGVRNCCKKTMKFTLSFFRIGFNSSKCKTMAKMTVARIKLLRNKRQVVVKQMRRDVALLLESGQDATARIRVEHVIREQNIMAANEILEIFCELVVARLSIVSKRRECPDDLKEGIASLIFAAPRCSDIPELCAIRDIFEKKYGRDFVQAATDLRPSCGVNSMLIDKLSVRTPSGEVKLKILKEIAKEYQIKWDTKESEMELLKPAEELIEGPNTFVSAASMPVKRASHLAEPKMTMGSSSFRSKQEEDNQGGKFTDAASAAEAAAESAKNAISAAQAAAYLANRDNRNQYSHSRVYNDKSLDSSFNNHNYLGANFSRNATVDFMPDNHQNYPVDVGDFAREKYESQNFERSHSNSNEVVTPPPKVQRRHSYNVPSTRTDIKFDDSESEYDEDINTEEPPRGSYQPPDRPAPSLPSANATRRESFPRVHPKLPDYDDLTARFESLKHPKPRK